VHIYSVKKLIPSLLFILPLVACSQKSTPNAPASPEDLHVARCASESDDPEPTEACALLCRVPGGVDECPVGTPCPVDPPNDGDGQSVIHKSLCARADTAATKSCSTTR
jgi:hypothetical protein